MKETKLKTRSEASRQNNSNFYFRREASLRVFSFVSLIIFMSFHDRNFSKNEKPLPSSSQFFLWIAN